jgi:hypothetical protein
MKLVKYIGLVCLLLTQSCSDTNSPFAPPPTDEVRIGSGTGENFSEGTIELGNASIPANGSTSVSVNFVDSNGTVTNVSGSVTFSSTCADLSQATFTNTTVDITSGSASTTFTDQGCTTVDTLTATATLDDETELVANANLTIAASSQGNTIILFTSVDQSTIALAGTGISTGIPEVSNVLFTVEDSLGNVITDEGITFSISTQAQSAGVRLQTTSATTNSNGEVTATVQSGSVSTSFRVTATVTDNTSLSTQSTPIVVATGLPDQDSFSLAATELNPRAWDVNGKEVTITAQVADRFNNPIQDGTSILFTTELGQIQSSCSTTNGSCSVEWTSSNPRGTTDNAGRTTILATVDGEESFQDNNSNGFFDDGDFLFKDEDNSGTFSLVDTDYDLPEAFRDDNENGTHDTGELFVESDSPADGYSIADGLYNGPGCQHTSLCSTKTSAKVRNSIVLIMAENTPSIISAGTTGPNYNDLCNSAVSCSNMGNSEFDVSGGSQTFVFQIVGAQNLQVLPAGTTIKFEATNLSIVGVSEHTVLSTNTNAISQPSAARYAVTLASDDTPGADGLLQITVTTPDSGPVTTFQYAAQD